jgi:hypothetical protein
MVVLSPSWDSTMAKTCQNTSASTRCGATISNNVCLMDGVSGSNHRYLFQDLNSVMGHATWDESTKSLKMLLARHAKLMPFHPYVIAFRLQNGPQPQSAPIRISAFGESGCEGLNVDGKCLGQDMKTQSTPFGVCYPAFVTARVSQANPFPGCNGQRNHINVTLETNIQLEAPWKMTMTGFHVSDVRYVAGLGNASSVNMAESATAFVIEASDGLHVAALKANTKYTLTFSVLNTYDSVQYKRQDLTVSSTMFGNAFSKVLDKDGSMDVDAVRIETANIFQSTPFPSAVNTITFSLEANVALPVGGICLHACAYMHTFTHTICCIHLQYWLLLVLLFS